MGLVHLLEHGERIAVFLGGDTVAEHGDDRVGFRFDARREPHRYCGELAERPHRLPSKRFAAELSDEGGEMRQILHLLGPEPALDRILDERRDKRGDHALLIARARRRKRELAHQPMLQPARPPDRAARAASAEYSALVSRENLEVVRRACKAALRRPKSDFTRVNALYHPDHELVALTSAVEGRTFWGAPGFREWLVDMSDAWESWEFALERAVEIDDDRILVVAVFSARSKRAGAPVEQRQGWVVTVQEGKVTRTETYSSPEEALRGVGLRE
jgi:ketosteroid isomerase-like protein